MPRPRALIAAAFVSMAAVSIAACDGETTHPPDHDVSNDWSCIDDGDLVRATGTITNHSSKTSFYRLEIEFRVDGEVIDERGASVDGVEPGETTIIEVVSDATDGGGGVTCRVTNIERYKA